MAQSAVKKNIGWLADEIVTFTWDTEKALLGRNVFRHPSSQREAGAKAPFERAYGQDLALRSVRDSRRSRWCIS